jgi:hypothetical protein
MYMHRLRQLMRTSTFTPLAMFLAFAIRVLASIDRPIARFPDSAGYETFHFLGEIDRFWSVPFLYAFFDNDAGRVALQVVVATATWSWCALILSRMSRYTRTVLTAVLLLGISPQVVRYDLALLSESLGISFFVFTIAASLHLRKNRNTFSVIIWLVSLTLCIYTRPVHLWVLVVVLLPPIATFIAHRGRTISLTTVALLVIAGGAFLQLRANSSTSALNFYTVLQERVITDDSRFDWFTQQGMPVSAGMRDATGYDFTDQFPPEVAAIIPLPEGQVPPTLMRVGGVPLAQWVQDNGWKTYAHYVLTHPADTFSRLTSLTNATLSPPNDDFLPLENGPMIPRVLFGSWELWSLLTAGALVVVFLKSRKDFMYLASLCITLIAVYATSLLASGIEHPRHSVTSAVALRLIAVVALVYALPRATRNREPDELADERE